MNDDIIRELNQMSQIYVPYLKRPEPGEIKMTGAEYDAISTIKAALDPQLTYLESCYVRGAENCDPNDDASWNKFINALKGYKADELLGYYNAALERYKAKQA